MKTLGDELRGVPSIVGKAPNFEWTSTPDEPQELFLQWLRYALDAGVPEARAATLSTIDEDGLPDARVLIVKDVADNCGFKIASSDESPKGRQLLGNPHCALTFLWGPLARSVRIRGIAERASASESAEDFLTRHPQARAIVLAGRQSSVTVDPATREEELKQAQAVMAATEDIVSPHWTVWTIVANSIEFWQGDPSRNHRRLRYVRTETGWDKQRLSP